MRKEYLIKVVNELVSTYDFIAIEHFKVTPYIWDGKTKESSLSRKQRAALNRERRLAVKLSLSISDTSWYANKLKSKKSDVEIIVKGANIRNFC